MSQSGRSSSFSSSVPSDVATSFQTDSGTAVASSNVIIFHGVGGSFSGSGNTVTFTTASSGTPWTTENSDFAAVSNNGYFCSASLTATLPASPSQGDTISIAVATSGIVTVQANTGQTIQLGSSVSSTAGTMANTFTGDCLTLVYYSTLVRWFSTSSQGNWTPS